MPVLGSSGFEIRYVVGKSLWYAPKGACSYISVHTLGVIGYGQKLLYLLLIQDIFTRCSSAISI
jgi:hypothetical protein